MRRQIWEGSPPISVFPNVSPRWVSVDEAGNDRPAGQSLQRRKAVTKARVVGNRANAADPALIDHDDEIALRPFRGQQNIRGERKPAVLQSGKINRCHNLPPRHQIASGLVG
jgi:hypothetical protein